VSAHQDLVVSIELVATEKWLSSTSPVIALGAILMVAIGGCTYAPATDGSSFEDAAGALLVGRLDGSVTEGCAWVVAQHSGNPVSVEWPASLRVAPEPPLRLVDDTGAVVAETDDLIRMSGGSAPRDHPFPERCQVSETIWIANEVEAAESP
jgi:hypothetical protein